MKFDNVLAERKNKVIYRDGDLAVKVFDESFPKSDILNEALNQARVEETGLNIPKIEEVTKIDGKWEQVPFYTVKDDFPYGHGEKSVLLASRFIDLTEEETMAIRFHMGAFDEAVKGGFNLSQVYEKYPLALELHIADMRATYLVENRQTKGGVAI